MWTARLSKSKWGDRIPQLASNGTGAQHWIVDGQPVDMQGVALANAALSDRGSDVQRWDDVPPSVYSPAERLKAMDADGVDYSVLYPSVAGTGGAAIRVGMSHR